MEAARPLFAESSSSYSGTHFYILTLFRHFLMTLLDCLTINIYLLILSCYCILVYFFCIIVMLSWPICIYPGGSVPRRFGRFNCSVAHETGYDRGIKVTCIQPCLICGLAKGPCYERRTLFPCRNYCGLKCLANAHELVSWSKLNVGILSTQERERSNNHEILQKSQVGCISVQCCEKTAA